MNPQQNIRVIIAGGGTGGHIFPALAIAKALQKIHPAIELLFVGARGKMEMEKIPAEGYSIVGLDIAGFNRSSLLKNVGLPFKIIRSFLQARRVLRQFKPDIVVGVGGYASFPVLYMAQWKHIPTLIQEQNSVAGKSNRILSRKAKAICVAYEGMEQYFPANKILMTGNPVRERIAESRVDRAAAIQHFKLDPSRKTVFAFGGSLGAKSINETLLASVSFFGQRNLQLIWQTGSLFYKTAEAGIAAGHSNIRVFEFIREMELAYAAADVIIARSGALSVAELCLLGKPVIFVPFPYASEDHQTTNALALVKHNAAVMVRDADAKSELLAKVESVLSNEQQQKLLQENILTMAIRDADQRIAQEIIKYVAA